MGITEASKVISNGETSTTSTTNNREEVGILRLRGSDHPLVRVLFPWRNRNQKVGILRLQGSSREQEHPVKKFLSRRRNQSQETRRLRGSSSVERSSDEEPLILEKAETMSVASEEWETTSIGSNTQLLASNSFSTVGEAQIEYDEPPSAETRAVQEALTQTMLDSAETASVRSNTSSERSDTPLLEEFNLSSTPGRYSHPEKAETDSVTSYMSSVISYMQLPEQDSQIKSNKPPSAAIRAAQDALKKAPPEHIEQVKSNISKYFEEMGYGSYTTYIIDEGEKKGKSTSEGQRIKGDKKKNSAIKTGSSGASTAGGIAAIAGGIVTLNPVLVVGGLFSTALSALEMAENCKHTIQSYQNRKSLKKEFLETECKPAK